MYVRPRKDRQRERTHARSFCVTTPLLPDVDVARADCATFLGVQAPGDHGEDARHDGVKDDVRVLDRADADGHAGRRLHPGLGVVVEAVHGEMVHGGW